MKFWNYAEEGNELYLEGPISTDTWWGDEVTPDMFKADLAKHPGDIVIWINSPGGDVIAASSIYTLLKEHPGKKTVKVSALAASAASVVAMAGDEVWLSPTAYLMIHRASTITWGNEDTLAEDLQCLREIDQGIAAIYAAKSGRPPAEMHQLMIKETWLNAARAKELGLADGILYQAEPSKPEGAAHHAAAWRGGIAAGPLSYSPTDSQQRLMAAVRARQKPLLPQKEPGPDPQQAEKEALRRKLMAQRFLAASKH